MRYARCMENPEQAVPDAHLGIRVDADMKAAIERAAKADERTVTQWVKIALRKALKNAR